MSFSYYSKPLATPNSTHVPFIVRQLTTHIIISSSVDSEPKLYPEKKEKWHRERFDEIQEQDETNRFGPRFKKSNHPLDIMVSYVCLDAASACLTFLTLYV